MSAIRSLRQFTASSRALSSLTCTRSFVCGRLPLKLAPRTSTSLPRWFSVSSRVFGDGTTDLALSQKLAEELQYENDANKDATEPDFLHTFKAQGIWQVEDSNGSDEVALTRTFGNESIRLMFSIADLQQEQEQEDFEQEESEEEAEPSPSSFPIRCSISVTKSSGSGALTIDAMCQEGTFIVDNISFYNDSKLGTELTAEADWKRRGLYIGPQFDTLDIGVQEEFEKFLQERGVNENLALFIPEYSELKEQKEYTRWLDSVKKFIDL